MNTTKALLVLLFLQIASGIIVAQNNCSSRSVVLVFQSCPEDFNKISLPNNGFAQVSDVSYIDDSLEGQVRTLLKGKGAVDTIVIPTSRSLIEVKLRYQFFYIAEYRFQLGDTVSFFFQGQVPYAHINNRKYSDMELNYTIKTPFKTQEGIPVKSIYELPVREWFPQLQFKSKKETTQELIDHLLASIERTDSLRKEKVISEDERQYRYKNILSLIYSYYKKNNEFRDHRLNIILKDTTCIFNGPDSSLHLLHRITT